MRWAIILNITIVFGLLILLGFSNTWPYPDLFPSTQHPNNKMIQFWDPNLITSLYQSLILSLFLGLSTTLAGFLTARYAKKATGMALLPFLTAPIILMVSLRYLFIKIGINNTWSGVFIGQFILAYPFAFLFIQPFWSEKWHELQVTSQELGASLTHAFYKVIGPVARPVLTLCFFHTFLISWFDYGTAFIIGAGQIKTLTILVYQYVQESNIYLAARASLLIGLPALLLLIINKQFILGKIPFYGT